MLTSACDVTRVVRAPINQFKIALLDKDGNVLQQIEADLTEKGLALLLERVAKILHRPESDWEKMN